jgi:hypothetical protein
VFGKVHVYMHRGRDVCVKLLGSADY